MYKVVKSDLPELEKRVRSIGRKLDKYGLKWHFETLGESVERVGVYAYDEINHYLVKIDEAVVDVVSYVFEMEPLKLGEWTPVAVIEHMALTEAAGTQNMVHAIDGAELVPEWWTVDNVCEHCGSKRRRNKTVMLRDASGAYKQVGTTCIKDFTGIDAADIIALYSSVGDIYEEEPRLMGESRPKSQYTETVNYLAHCIGEIATNGYNKDETKRKAYEAAKASYASIDLMTRAQTIIDFYSGLDLEKYIGSDTEIPCFELNVKTAVTAEYSKISGFVAYAPIAYQKALEKIAEKQRRDAEGAASTWQGKQGEKITTTVEHMRSFSYESDYGMQYIHLFKDSAGNIYKWSTAKGIEDRAEITITGTIKAHGEYEGQKQTVLTRCKIA